MSPLESLYLFRNEDKFEDYVLKELISLRFYFDVAADVVIVKGAELRRQEK